MNPFNSFSDKILPKKKRSQKAAPFAPMCVWSGHSCPLPLILVPLDPPREQCHPKLALFAGRRIRKRKSSSWAGAFCRAKDLSVLRDAPPRRN